MVDMVFDGLDTKADVYLNNALILSANNMFRRWIVNNVSQYLKGTENNNLTVFFYSAAEHDIAAEK
jgi:beta-mannosidase